MNKKKLLSVVLAALLVLDVVCFGLTAVYHATECDAGNASVSFEVIDSPAGEYSTDVIIVDYAYESAETETAPKIYAAGIEFDKSNYASDPMVFENMFPGDRVSKTYKVLVHRQNPVSLWFRVDIQDNPAYEKLAEVLMLKVSVDGQVTYDGLMKDFNGHNSGFPSFYEERITQDLEYHIEVYLDTSVGNEYMQKTLKCDYSWTIYENMPDPTPPDDGNAGGSGDGDTTDKDNPVDDDDKDDVEVETPDESREQFETFIYIPEPCHFGIASIIMGMAFLLLLAALILNRNRKENGLEK